MFSSLLAISPIRNKIIQIKEMEKVYQAMANSMTGIEIDTMYRQGSILHQPPNLFFYEEASTPNTTSCLTFTTSTTEGTCKIFKISTTSDLVNLYLEGFEFSTGSIIKIQRSFANGFKDNISRAIIIDYR